MLTRRVDEQVVACGVVIPDRDPERRASSRAIALLRNRKFVDSLLEGRVRCELVSEFLESIKKGSLLKTRNSLLAGKIQGNSSILASDIQFSIESTSRIRDLQSKFPAKWNREIIVPEQGIKSADQGSFSPDQGRPSGSGQICQNGQRNEPLSGVRVIWPLFAYRRSGTEN